MRLNKLRADALDDKPGSAVNLATFDRIMAAFCAKYEPPLGELPPGQKLQAHRILESAGIDLARCEDFARWISQEEWYLQAPNQGRALNAIPRNILTAVRFGEYLRSLEVKEITPDE